jgi:hypothetical protein
MYEEQEILTLKSAASPMRTLSRVCLLDPYLLHQTDKAHPMGKKRLLDRSKLAANKLNKKIETITLVSASTLGQPSSFCLRTQTSRFSMPHPAIGILGRGGSRRGDRQ